MCKFTLTPQAAERIRSAAYDSNSEGMFLRITGRRGDAGSVIYGMGFDELREKDLLLESQGISIVITDSQALLLDGASLDFAKLNTGDSRFVFVNPNDFGCACNLGPCGHCDTRCRTKAENSAGMQLV